MAGIFLYGTLRHLPLLEVVLGRAPVLQQARLVGYTVNAVTVGSFPIINKSLDGVVDGDLLVDLTPDELARIDYYEAAFGYTLQDCQVVLALDEVAARVYFATSAVANVAGPWFLKNWCAEWGDITVLAAQEFMDGFGVIAPELAGSRYSQVLSRAATRHRAMAEQVATEHYGGPTHSNVKTAQWRRPYSNFFVLEEHDVQFPRFNGGMSGVVTRAAMVGGDAVTVLPYDPVRDRVMFIEQFRIGPYVRGDKRAWTLEPVAGRIDPGETPEEAARRELVEEAGLNVSRLIPLPSYYPSPGAYTEYLYNFVGLAELPDDAAGVGGVASEDEDIKSHILDFKEAIELVSSGAANTGPLILSLLWLQGQRDLIRQSA